MKCPHCQREISDGAQSCPYCWKDVSSCNSVIAPAEGENEDDASNETNSKQINADLAHKVYCLISQESCFRNVKGMDERQFYQEFKNGGRFVHFAYCYSTGVLTVRKYSDKCFFIRSSESSLAYSVKYTLFTLFAGWWGIPFGPIFSIWALYINCTGGKDVTQGIIDYVSNYDEEGNTSSANDNGTRPVSLPEELSSGEKLIILITDLLWLYIAPLVHFLVYLWMRNNKPIKAKQYKKMNIKSFGFGLFVWIALLGLGLYLPDDITDTESHVQKNVHLANDLVEQAKVSVEQAEDAIDNLANDLIEQAKVAIDSKDYKAAYNYFQQAEQLGHPYARYYLRIMNLNGTGVEPDSAKAFNMFSHPDIKDSP